MSKSTNTTFTLPNGIRWSIRADSPFSKLFRDGVLNNPLFGHRAGIELKRSQNES